MVNLFETYSEHEFCNEYVIVIVLSVICVCYEYKVIFGSGCYRCMDQIESTVSYGNDRTGPLWLSHTARNWEWEWKNVYGTQ